MGSGCSPPILHLPAAVFPPRPTCPALSDFPFLTHPTAALLAAAPPPSSPCTERGFCQGLVPLSSGGLWTVAEVRGTHGHRDIQHWWPCPPRQVGLDFLGSSNALAMLDSWGQRREGECSSRRNCAPRSAWGESKRGEGPGRCQWGARSDGHRLFWWHEYRTG